MNSRNESARLGVLIPQVGVSGGLAEIFMSYRLFTPARGIIVAREMTARLFPALALGAAGAWLGAAIHTTLAVAVGYAFAFVIWKPLVRGLPPGEARAPHAGHGMYHDFLCGVASAESHVHHVDTVFDDLCLEDAVRSGNGPDAGGCQL